MPKLTTVTDIEDAVGVAPTAPMATGRTTHPHAITSLASMAKEMARDTDRDRDRLVHRHLPGRPTHPGGEPAPALDFSLIDRIEADAATPGALAISPDGSRLYVTNCADDSLWVIDVASFTVLDVISGISEPGALAVAADGRAYVGIGSASQDGVAVIDPAGGVTAVPLTQAVRDLVVVGRQVYASRTGDAGADIAVLDLATGRIEQIVLAAEAGAVAGALAVSPDGQRLYVAVQRESTGHVAVVDTYGRCVTSVIETGTVVNDIVVAADGATIYLVGNVTAVDDAIEIVDARTLAPKGRIRVDGGITQLVLGAGGDRLYLVGADAVTVLSTRSGVVIGTAATGAAPSAVVESRDGRLFVADYAGGVSALAITADTRGVLPGLKPAV